MDQMTGILFPFKETYFNSIQFKKCNGKNNISCPITLTKLTEGDNIAVLPCLHTFQREALLKWINKGKATCPICRFEIPADDKDIFSIIINDSIQKQEAEILEDTLNEILN